MSLGIVIKGTEGLVLAAESRVTLTTTTPHGPSIQVNFDNATKLLNFGEPHTYVGAVTYGLAAIGLRTAHSFIPEFENTLSNTRMTIQDVVQQMSNFFMSQWNSANINNYTGPDMTFVVAGFNQGEPYGRIFEFGIPNHPNPHEHYSNPSDFGIIWGGQREFVDRLLKGYDERVVHIIQTIAQPQPNILPQIQQAIDNLQMQIPLQAMSLQDCVDLALFFIRTTISAQKLTVGIRGCGGDIDVATITRRENLKFIQQKKVKGEK